MGDFRLGALT